MNLIERIASWVGFDFSVVNKPEVNRLREMLEAGRQHKRLEAYAEAEASFSEAQQLAEALHDQAILLIVGLHRADLLIRQARYGEAEALLSEMLTKTEAANEGAQHAYTLSALGTLEQARGDWAAARQYYERAMERARQANAPGAEGRAMGHLADTYLHEHNASYAVHLLREAMPKLNASGDIELSSYFVGRLGQALLATGQDTEGDQSLGRALRLAEGMQYRRFQRLWHQALGERAAALGRDNEAYKQFESALAIMPTDAPERAAVYRAMAKACMNLGRRDEALDYARRAAELGDDDPVTMGVLGTVLHAAGQSAEALPYLQRAVASGAETGASSAFDHFDGAIWRGLAAAQAATGEAAAALITYTQALSIVRQQGDERTWRLEEARIQRDLGAFYARQHDHQAALKAYSAALEIYQLYDYHAQIARLFCDIADLRTSLGQGQRAMKDYEQALMALNAVNDPDTRGVVLSNAARAYVEQGDLETAEAFFSESIKLAQKAQDRAAEATRRGNYGWFLLATGRPQRALSALDYALRQSRELGLTLHIAVQSSNMAQAHADLGQHEQALALHREAVGLLTAADHPYWAAMVRVHLAAHLLRMQKAEQAGTEALDEAIHILTEARATGEHLANPEVSIRAQTELARAALMRAQPDEAALRVAEAIAQARRILSRRLLAEALLLASEIQMRLNAPDRARELWDEARRLFELLHHPAAHKTPGWLAA